MELNQIFKIEDYSKAYSFIQGKNYIIQEIEKNKEGDRQFQIVEQPELPQKDLINQRIAELKILLANEDYKTIKYIQGQLSEEEFAEVKKQCQAWRDEINKLEGGGNE